MFGKLTRTTQRSKPVMIQETSPVSTQEMIPSSAEYQSETAPFQRGSLWGPNTGDFSTQFTWSHKGNRVQSSSLGATGWVGSPLLVTVGLEALPQTQLGLSGSLEGDNL